MSLLVNEQPGAPEEWDVERKADNRPDSEAARGSERRVGLEPEPGSVEKRAEKSEGGTEGSNPSPSSQAEASNRRGDIWWGGTGDPHMREAEEGLTIDYESPNLARDSAGQDQERRIADSETDRFRDLRLEADAQRVVQK